jgi:hypothetical protein
MVREIERGDADPSKPGISPKRIMKSFFGGPGVDDSVLEKLRALRRTME